MPRFFSLPEAQQLLPEVEILLRQVIHQQQDHKEADTELTGIVQRIALSGGMIAPRERVEQLRRRKDASARALKSTLEKIHELGCQVKDVNIGLIDFPTLYRNQEVYLCWKLGESDIAYWHHIEDGYRGRRPIDEEFRANHRGEN